jgi:ornithine carbamoyltransferase
MKNLAKPMPAAARHVLSASDFKAEDLQALVEYSLSIAEGRRDGERPLAGKAVGIYFRKTSTRTRTAFSVGAAKLGAHVIAYGPNDLQIATGETLSDTGRVLANYLDALVIRTNDTVSEMRELASQERMAVINAMSENEHPTQAIADLVAMREALGRLAGTHVLYLGEGNNTAASLALAVGKLPAMRLTLVTPPGYGLAPDLLAAACDMAAATGSQVEQHHDMERLPHGVDVVYTARWLTMGVPKRDADWLASFRRYCVTSAVMAEVSKPDGSTIFMHDLPAMRGYEVLDEVLDGPQSIALRQAFHKMTSAMSVLAWATGAI